MGSAWRELLQNIEEKPLITKCHNLGETILLSRKINIFGIKNIFLYI